MIVYTNDPTVISRHVVAHWLVAIVAVVCVAGLAVAVIAARKGR